MKEILKRGATSNILRVFLPDSASTTGAGKTGLTNTSTGLIISTIADNEATATTYTAAASNTETITTLGTYSAPSSGKARFKEVDATNFPGVYEIQIADARFNVSNSTKLLVSIQASGVAPTFAEVQLVAVDLYDTVRFGLTALPNVASGSAGAIITSGTGTAQLSVSSGAVTVGTINNNTITAASINADAITAAKVASDVGLEIADAVWDEAYSGHTTAGSFGKLMDILRKANLVTEGTVTSATANNTTMQFVSTTTDIANKADDHWRGQTLLFVSGNLTGQSTTVARFNTTSNTITLDSALTEAPALNDEFVMMPVHIHPIDEIGEAVLNARIGSVGQLGYVSATTVTSGPDISGLNGYVAGDTVRFITSAPTNFSLGTTYYVLATNLSPTNFQLSASSGGSAITPGTAATYTIVPNEERTMRSALQYLRNKIAVSSGTLTVYAEDDTAVSWTAALTTDSAAQPIVTFDPAG